MIGGLHYDFFNKVTLFANAKDRRNNRHVGLLMFQGFMKCHC